MEFEKTTVFQISSSFVAKYFADPISILQGGSPPPNMQGIDYVSSPQQVSLHPMRSPYFTFVSIPARLFANISASMTQLRLGSTTTIVEPPNSKRPFSLPRATPSSVEVLGNFRRLHFFLALMSHTTCPAILDFSTKILCPFWAFFY